MKNILQIIVLLFLNNLLFGQNFYEVKWGNDVKYTALITYYNLDQVSVRVNYTTLDDVFKVVKYDCKGRYEFQDNGQKYFIFDGNDAELVYESEKTTYGYIADNFFFTNLDENNVYEELFVRDDQIYNEDEIVKHTYKASFKVLDPKVQFTESYLNSFYYNNDSEYKTLLSFYQGTDTVYLSEDYDDEIDLNNITLHLLVAADTKDRNIGSSTQQDLEDIFTTFSKISSELGIKMKKYSVFGDNFSKNRILENLNNIPNSSNDIIIFYYSGHGFNDTSKQSDYASMSLDGPDYSLEELHYRLRNKNARLSMVIGDLCNSIPETRQATGSKESIPFKSGYFFDSEKLYKLFIKSEGTILSSSSSKGEWSFCIGISNTIMGNGHFTNSFIESIIMETSKVYKYSTDWNQIFDRAFDDAAKNTNEKINQNNLQGQHGIKYISINYN